MRNPLKTLVDRAETSVVTGAQKRVRTHFEENKRTYYACAATAVITASLTARVRPSVTNVTVINNLP